ncbi:DNA polymerase IV [Calidifontibacter sp. DB0510]|uniref:DNA polymerase IV n=1 Tax=Metallococcus carri TaxID=1656884 RepID=A0A967AZV2_9MICO|nr:DNA polymerase IV [Metallococcus carri]NHN54860.1 DNA polymerase IV [Metallococcus carri]NOP37205.1 DNA polymerase IV [Calidifontibacter sp. DB2511S]
MRSTASILHLDLDAFFAAVEQRDKPSLRGKPVVVGGIGPRGVVATASYEARAFGARSAMPTAEARRRCPAGTAFLYPRGAAYRRTSAVVMELLHELSPVVEQVSIDEAYVDLQAGDLDLSTDALETVVRALLDRIRVETGGLTASAGLASSKMLAKIGSDLDKPAGLVVVPPGQELHLLAPLPVRVLSGVGPVTATRLRTFGVETVADLQRLERADLVSIFGEAHGGGLAQLAQARDDRAVVTEREAKSISAEETFPVDVVDRARLDRELASLAERVTARLGEHGSFARTVTLKLRHHDFTTMTRSETLTHPTGDPAAILAIARRLLAGADIGGGLRLIGVGVAGLSAHAQERLLFEELDGPAPDPQRPVDEQADEDAQYGRHTARWNPGEDVEHDDHGPGWVWGSGLGRVTVRFEGPLTAPGPVRTFSGADQALRHTDPPNWRSDA